MQRYFIFLAYDGTAYHGWQIQPNACSVQQTLDEALSLLLRRPIACVGAGRTDTGVHARLMVAHFDDLRPEDEAPLDPKLLTSKLNKVLPPDISVYGIVPVTPRAHARFDATARTYHYYITLDKDIFARPYACRLFGTLDFERMNEAAARLTEVEDFTSFSKLHTDVKTNICHVSRAQWVAMGGHRQRFEITADRFLRNMVRAIVGTLVEVGRHKLSVEDFMQVIRKKDRCAAGQSMPGHALFLTDIRYPETLFPEGMPDDFLPPGDTPFLP